MSDAQQQEREALNRLMDSNVLTALFALERYVVEKGPNPPEIFDDRLGDLRRDVLAAVRAALVEEIVAKVEALRKFGAHPDDFYYTLVGLADVSDVSGYDLFLDRDDVLDTIRGLAAPTTEER